MKKILATTLFAILSLTTFAYAEGSATTSSNPSVQTQGEEKPKTLEITEAWARASIPSNKNSSAYMKVKNNTNEEFVIIAATSPDVANNVELHNSFVDEKGISRMTSIDKVVVPVNSEIEFKTGSMHIMLMNLKKNLVAGDKFKINLIFDGKDPMEVEVEVK